MLKCFACAKASCLREVLDSDHSTNGGANDTDEKELAVNPSGPISDWVVITVTPVPNRPKAWRKGTSVSGPGANIRS